MTNGQSHLPLLENAWGPLPIKKSSPAKKGHRARPQTEKGNEIWLVTLSDLLMLLMIFFVVLFGMAMQREKKAEPSRDAGVTTPADFKADGRSDAPRDIPAPPSASRKTSAGLEADLIAALNPEQSQPGVMIKRNADLVILTFPERIVFDPGQAQLKNAAQTTLDSVASFIKERPYLTMEVQGHTDDRPINTTHYPSNWELSLDRAMQVSRALIGRGVNPIQLSVKGFGEYQQLVPNDSDENRLMNRRVEIQFSVSPPS
jgi:chemotaxis protein MotB